MLTFRTFEPSDSESVWKLHLAAMDGEQADLEDAFFADLREIPESYLATGGDFLLGLVDGRVVACGGYLPRSTSQVEIKRMRVDPAHRRLGYGRALLEALEERAMSRGYGLVYLETTVVQAPAVDLYRRSGYRQIGKAEVRGFEVVQLCKSLYRKRLTSSRCAALSAASPPIQH